MAADHEREPDWIATIQIDPDFASTHQHHRQHSAEVLSCRARNSTRSVPATVRILPVFFQATSCCCCEFVERNSAPLRTPTGTGGQQ